MGSRARPPICWSPIRVPRFRGLSWPSRRAAPVRAAPWSKPRRSGVAVWTGCRRRAIQLPADSGAGFLRAPRLHDHEDPARLPQDAGVGRLLPHIGQRRAGEIGADEPSWRRPSRSARAERPRRRMAVHRRGRQDAVTNESSTRRVWRPRRCSLRRLAPSHTPPSVGSKRRSLRRTSEPSLRFRRPTARASRRSRDNRQKVP